LNIDIDHIGERSMCRTLNQTTAAILSLLLATMLWLPPVGVGRDTSISAQGPVTATYALPLAA
jgi:hypothetical protein